MKLQEQWAKVRAHAWCAWRVFTVGGSYGVRSNAFVDAGKTGEMVYVVDGRERPIKVFYQTGPIPASIWRMMEDMPSAAAINAVKDQLNHKH